jgi:hypothetical protein
MNALRVAAEHVLAKVREGKKLGTEDIFILYLGTIVNELKDVRSEVARLEDKIDKTNQRIDEILCAASLQQHRGCGSRGCSLCYGASRRHSIAAFGLTATIRLWEDPPSSERPRSVAEVSAALPAVGNR